MSWERVKLGTFLRARENRFKPDDRSIRGLKRVDKIDFSGNLNISNSPSKTDMILVKKGDLLISGINVAKGAVIVYEGIEDIVATIHYSSYEFDKNKIDIEFLKLFLKSPEFLEAIKEQVPGGIKTEIKPKHFLPLEVLMPTEIDEQRKVVSSFSVIKNKNDILSTELTYQLDLVKQLRQAFLREAMQGKLVPQDPNDAPASELLKKIKAEKAQLIKEGKLKKEKELPPIKAEEIPFEIPKSWVWCRLGDVSHGSEAGSSFKCIEVPITGTEWGVIKVSAVSWTDFLENQNKLYSKSKPTDLAAQIHVGDFIISRANTSELVGKSVVVKSITKNLLLSDKTIRFKFSKFVSVDYVNLWNNGSHARSYYALKGTGSSPSMKNITREHMNNLIIPLPPLSEQHRIVAKLEQLMHYCDELEQSIKQSQTQNEQLLQQVLREALSQDISSGKDGKPKGEYKIKDELSLAAEPSSYERDGH